MMHFSKLTLGLAMAASLVAASASAQVLLTPGVGATYTQSFNSLIQTGTDTAPKNGVIGSTGPLPNWYHDRTGTGTTILAGTGSSNTGALYSFGSASVPTDRSLGTVGSGGAGAGNFAYGVRLRNNSLFPILSFNVSYTGEQWRDGGTNPAGGTPATQTVSFFYTVSSTALTAPIPAPPAGTPAIYPTPAGFNAVTALDMTTPTIGNTTTAGVALDGNNALNRVLVGSTINFVPSVQPGHEVFLMWGDPNQPNSDHALSVDDFTVVATFDTTLAVDLTSFTASVEGPTSPVTIAWSTAAELDNAGFFVKNAATGEVIGGLVPAEGSESTGATYSVVDATPLAEGETRTYILEDIDLAGTITVHGPVSVIAPSVASSVADWTMY